MVQRRDISARSGRGRFGRFACALVVLAAASLAAGSAGAVEPGTAMDVPRYHPAPPSVTPYAYGADSEACLLAVLSLHDEGPGIDRVAACGPDVDSVLLRFALSGEVNGLIRSRALVFLSSFVSPEEALFTFAAVVENPAEHSYFRAKAVMALEAFATSHPADVLAEVDVALDYRAEPFVRERAIVVARAIPGHAALNVLKAHRLRERTRWVMPVLKDTISEIEAR